MKTLLFSTGCAESRIKVSVLAVLHCHWPILAVSTYLRMHENPPICTFWSEFQPGGFKFLELSAAICMKAPRPPEEVIS
jgi:hypothetical protein